MNDWFEIFAAGTWKDSQGRQKTYSREDLDKIIASYDPGNHEAPIVIGHPADNHPAWGWIAGLKRVGDKLLALPRGVVDEFAEMVKKGLFKKRSISLNPDLSLRHVGFLGAVPPAVKGLEDVRFEIAPEALEYCADMAEDTWKMGLVGQVLQRLRDFIIDKFDVETANRVVSPFDIDELKLEPAVETGDDMNKEFQERLTALELENRQLREQAAAREAEASAYKQQLSDRERQSRRENTRLFCEKLVKAGRITEGQSENIVLVLESLHEVAPLQYADKKEKPAIEVLQEFLQGLPEQIVLREVADGLPGAQAQDEADDAVRQASDYSAPVNDARLKLRNEAWALAQKENIGFGAAVRRILAQ